MVHPLNIEINVDFNIQEKYGIYDGIITADGYSPPIIYSISNLRKNVSVDFYCKSRTIDIDDKYVDLKNPFMVCLKNDCEYEPYRYKFVKGNKYKIIVSFQEIKSDLSTVYHIPPFSFEKIPEYEENEEEEELDNKEIFIKISLISFLLFLIF